MKQLFFIVLSIFFSSVAVAQKSYIQVNGEPDLSVFLDNQFKGKTTAELGGYIIENVIPGSHKIKIVKQGYTPFEESISVKPGEVFAYKVKPFAKHAVTISEYGNSGEAAKQVEARTGKLVVQSVPIQIKITMPDIEGVKNVSKAKDEWVVNNIQVGRYDIEMSFGSKTIKKQIVVTENDVTNVFVNMLNGEFSSTTSMSPAKIRASNEAYFKSVLNKYSIKRAATPSDFYAQTPGSGKLAGFKQSNNSIRIIVPEKAILKNPSLTPGPRYIGFDRKSVEGYDYALKAFEDYNAALEMYNELINEFKKNVDVRYLYIYDSDPLALRFETFIDKQRTIIGYELRKVGTTRHEVRITFGLY